MVVFIVLSRYWTNIATAIHPLPDLEFKHIVQKFVHVETSPFSGPPSFEVDTAWHELLKYTTLRASAAELKSSNQTSVELPNGGFMVWLGVFHQLHCIKMLRHWIYRDYYHPNLPESDRAHWESHVDQSRPMLNTKPIEHQCIDWDVLMGSLKQRVVDSDEMSRMVNPTTT
ncbi:hypothetical protein CHU98_g1122 [Xylaria longipes]|nr:hypothetical protein CHU98_g1122 [Xylaria longipes]